MGACKHCGAYRTNDWCLCTGAQLASAKKRIANLEEENGDLREANNGLGAVIKERNDLKKALAAAEEAASGSD